MKTPLMALAQEVERAPVEWDSKTGQEVVSIPDACGAAWWAIFHNTAQAIHDAGCSSCGEHAITLMQFMHDLVNIRLGKPLHVPAVAEEWLPVVEEYRKHLGSAHPGDGTVMGKTSIRRTRKPTCPGLILNKDETELLHEGSDGNYRHLMADFKLRAAQIREHLTDGHCVEPEHAVKQKLEREVLHRQHEGAHRADYEWTYESTDGVADHYLGELEGLVGQFGQEQEHEHSQGFPKIKVKPGTPQKMDEDDNPTFERWMQRIDAVLTKLRGVSVHDLPDAPFCDWYDARLRPIHAANKVLRRASSEQVLEQSDEQDTALHQDQGQAAGAMHTHRQAAGPRRESVGGLHVEHWVSPVGDQGD